MSRGSAEQLAARTVAVLFVAAVIAFLVGPLLVTIAMSLTSTNYLVFPPSGMSFKWYTQVLESAEWRQSALISLIVATLVSVAASGLGLPAAYALVRAQRLRLRGALTGFFVLPLLTPIMVLALGQAILELTVGYSATIIGLVFAETAIALPFVVLNNAISIRAVDRNLELAAQTLGATPMLVFWRVTLPLIRRGLIAGALFAFIASWDEAAITIFLTGPGFYTLPIQLLNQVEDYLSPAVAAVSGCLTLVALVASFAAFLLNRAGGTRIFGR